MSSNLRRRQAKSESAQEKAARVAGYIKEEFPVPRGQASGPMLRKEDRNLAAIVLSIAQAVWFVTIAVGIIFYAGKLAQLTITGVLSASQTVRYTSYHTCTLMLSVCKKLHEDVDLPEGLESLNLASLHEPSNTLKGQCECSTCLHFCTALYLVSLST